MKKADHHEENNYKYFNCNVTDDSNC